MGKNRKMVRFYANFMGINDIVMRLCRHFPPLRFIGRVFLAAIACCVVAACGSTGPAKTTIASADTASGKANPPVDIDATSRNLLDATLGGKDSVDEYFFDYTARSCGLFYFKAGHIFSSSYRSAIMVYTINDSTLQFRIYTQEAGKWNAGNLVTVPSITFHPAYFLIDFSDYNFDGSPDVFVNLYQTMGLCDGFGYLLTYDPTANALVLHPESIEMPNITADARHKLILSRTADEDAGKRIIAKYKWVKDSLVMYSRKATPVKIE